MMHQAKLKQPSKLALMMASVVLAFLSISVVKVNAIDKYFVNPTSGVDAPGYGTTSNTAFDTLNYALGVVPCGSLIELASDKDYPEDVIFNRSDCVNNSTPIVVTGNRSAHFIGAGSTYIFKIITGNLQLDDFTINGQYTSGQYRSKLLYTYGSGVTDLELSRMAFKNALTECVRLKNSAHDNIIRDNKFENCGRGGTSNGEAIYVGTDRGQLADPNIPDESNDNLIYGNTFNLGISAGTGSECINIKEGSSGNIIEDNECYYQNDANSGGFDIRGTDNLIQNNIISNGDGAGIRLGPGSDNLATDGIDNTVISNTITNNAGNGIKIMSSPQTQICANTFSGNSSNVGGTYGSTYSAGAAAPC